MTRQSQVSDGVAERAMDVVAHLSGEPFTLEQFLSHATGLNAVSNARDVGPMLVYLTDHDVIRQVNTPSGDPTRWMRC